MAFVTLPQPSSAAFSSWGGNTAPTFGAGTIAVSQKMTFPGEAGGGFIYSVSAHVQRQTSASVKLRFILYEWGLNNQPGKVLAVSPVSTTTNVNQNDGTLVTGTFTVNALTAERLANQNFAVGFWVESGSVKVGRSTATGLSVPLHKATSTSVPSLTSAVPTWQLFTANNVPMIQATFVKAESPTAALVTNKPPATNATVSPTIGGTFTTTQADAAYQKLVSYEIEVTTGGQNVGPIGPIAWTGTGNTFEYLWDKTELVNAQPYSLRIRVYGRGGAVSNWTSPFSFSVVPGGIIDTTGSAPNGRLEWWENFTNFTALWTDANTANCVAVQFQLAPPGISVESTTSVTNGPSITVNIAPNTPISIARTTAFPVLSISPTLASGRGYQWRVRGKKSGDSGFGPWSDPVSFDINSPPGTPALPLETGNGGVAAPPRVTWRVVDNDEEVVGQDIKATIELIKGSSSPVLITDITTVSDVTTGEMYYQFTSTDMPNTGNYQWRVKAIDISAESAGAPLAYRESQYSPARNIIYAPRPAISISSPLPNAVLTTSSPTVSWTVANDPQKAFTVSVLDARTLQVVYTSGRRTTATTFSQSFTIGADGIPSGIINGGSYLFRVEVVGESSGLSTTVQQPFSVQYDPAEVITGLSVSLVSKNRDYEASTPFVSWTSVNVNNFVGYVVQRKESGSAAPVPVAFIPQQQTTGWLDHAAPPNKNVSYLVHRLVRSGTDIRQSPTEEVALGVVPVTVPTLTSLYDGSNLHAPMMWLSSGLSGSFEREAETYVTWGAGGAPTLIITPEQYGRSSLSLELTLRSDARGTLQEHFDDIKALAEAGHPMVYRGEDYRLFCRIASYSWQRGGPGTRTVSLELEEIYWNESPEVPA